MGRYIKHSSLITTRISLQSHTHMTHSTQSSGNHPDFARISWPGRETICVDMRALLYRIPRADMDWYNLASRRGQTIPNSQVHLCTTVSGRNVLYMTMFGVVFSHVCYSALCISVIRLLSTKNKFIKNIFNNIFKSIFVLFLRFEDSFIINISSSKFSLIYSFSLFTFIFIRFANPAVRTYAIRHVNICCHFSQRFFNYDLRITENITCPDLGDGMPCQVNRIFINKMKENFVY